MAGSTSEFIHSNVLFQTQDGRPLTFYCLPGEVKTQIHPLVKHGGGILTSRDRDENTVKLAAEGQSVTGDNNYSYRYILDCVEKNTLLPLENYKLKGMSSTVSSSKRSVAMKASGKGREPFLKSEKVAILKYVAENSDPGRPVAGNKIWKEMELYKVTKHSWHAMRDHYLKHLKGKEHLFNMTDRLKYSKLQFRMDENSTMEDDDDDLVELHSGDSDKDGNLDIDTFDSSAEEQQDPANPTEDSVVTSSSNIGQDPALVSTPLTRSPLRPGQKVCQVEGVCGRGLEMTVVAGVGALQSTPDVQSMLSACSTTSDDMDNHLSVLAVDVKKVKEEDTPPEKRIKLHQNDAKDGEEQDKQDDKHQVKGVDGGRIQKEQEDGGQREDGEDKQKEDGEDEQMEDGEDGQKKDGEDGQKNDGEDEQMEDGKDGQMEDIEDKQKEDGEDGQKKDGEDGQKENGKDEQKEGGEDGQKEDGKDEQRKDGEDEQKEDGEDGQKVDGDDEQKENGTRQNKQKRDEEDEAHLLTVLEGCVKIKELMIEFDISLLMATRALYYNCGHVGATRTFLRTGRRPDDIPRPGWSRADESLHFDSDKENQKN
ncbi:uncharacterized protein LOC144918319 isoform X1 [Branchiostoma floridae x Branchiostoma belcheri]